jgi:hypothetical protein
MHHHSKIHRPSTPLSSIPAGQDTVLGRFSTAFGLCGHNTVQYSIISGIKRDDFAFSLEQTEQRKENSAVRTSKELSRVSEIISQTNEICVI